MNGYGWMAGMNWFGMTIVILFCGMLIALLVWGLLTRFTMQRKDNLVSAKEILERRFAQGEMTRDEFVQAREMLRSVPHA
jgi:uncharacterized membrane protein